MLCLGARFSSDTRFPQPCSASTLLIRLILPYLSLAHPQDQFISIILTGPITFITFAKAVVSLFTLVVFVNADAMVDYCTSHLPLVVSSRLRQSQPSTQVSIHCTQPRFPCNTVDTRSGLLFL